MNAGAVKRIIYVAQEHRKTLAAIAASVTGLAYEKRHQEVKRQLQANGVPHGEVDGHPSQIPAGHSYWHA